MKKHLINIHTSTGTTAPTNASLYLGEIAVQHTPNDPGLWIKMGTSESSTEYEKFIGKTEITNLINQSNILGSGYTYSGLPYVNSATTLADAYSALTNEMIKDGQVVAAALNDLNVRVDEISAATGDNTELLEYIQENEEVVAGALNNLNERVGVVETHMTGDYIPITGYQTATGTSEEELSLEETDTVNEALGKLQKQMLDNEEAIAAGLNDLNTRLENVDELIAHNTGVTQLSGAVRSLSAATNYGLREAFSEMSRLSSATRSLSSATQTFAKATLTVNLNGVEQGKYTPWSGNTVIDLTAVTNGSNVLLTGYELATGTTEEELAIVATDTVNEAFGKIQKQNYDNEAVVAGALNDLDERITFLEVSGSSSDDLEELSGAVVSKEIVVAAALNDLNSRIVELSGNTGGGGGGADVAPLSAAVLSLSAAVVTISGNSSGGGSSDPNAITGITMNGNAVSVSSRVAALGTVVTAQTQLSKGTATGNGNVVTDINVSNHQITLVKSYSAAPADQFVTLSGAAHNKITSLSAGTISVSGFAHNKITALSAATTAHTADTTVHITSAERTAWNNKISNVQADWNTTAATDGSYIKNKPTIPTVPTSNTAFTNDAGYITTETDPTVPAWAKATNKPTYTASEVGALPTGTTLDNVADGTTRKLSNYATTGTVNTLSAATTAHTGNSDIHVTTAEKSTWNGKANTSDITITGLTVGGTNATVTNKVAAVPTASTSAFGVVKVPAQATSFLTNSNGTISVATGTGANQVAKGSDFAAVSAATTAHTNNSAIHVPTGGTNGQVLMIQNGVPAWVTPSTITYSSSAPSGGKDGDIWIQTS